MNHENPLLKNVTKKPKENQMEMTDKEIHELARYIATYLAEEDQHVDLFTVRDAIEAYLGGAR